MGNQHYNDGTNGGRHDIAADFILDAKIEPRFVEDKRTHERAEHTADQILHNTTATDDEAGQPARDETDQDGDDNVL